MGPTLQGTTLDKDISSTAEAASCVASESCNDRYDD